MADFFKMLEQFRTMQTRLQAVQEELARKTFTATAGGGMVTVEVDGKMMLKRVKIDKSVVNPDDLEMLEDLIVAALNDARGKADAAANEQMKSMTQGLDLPPGLKLPF